MYLKKIVDKMSYKVKNLFIDRENIMLNKIFFLFIALAIQACQVVPECEAFIC